MNFLINLIIYSALMLILGACSPKEAANFLAIPVEMPVFSSCISDAPEKPDWYMDKVTNKPPNQVEFLKAILSDHLRAKGYILELEAAVTNCL